MSEPLATPVVAERARSPAAAELSRWRASPARAAVLFAGLWVFGTGEALLVLSALGNSPWTVFAQGAAERTGLSIGVLTILIGALVVLLWWPLRQRPGLGTIANVILVGVAIDVTLALLEPPDALGLRSFAMLGGIALVALGSGLYLGTALGPGPRDGLMTGLHRVSGRPIFLVRAVIELSVLAAGVALGGTAGLGTVLFALLIGPGVQLALRLLSRVPSVDL
ncbi:hypothetical protein HJD18_06740 [Thermoleophilia bacterium SCSIO 60948]|nr:hypothetical protein HJD18_06740 [Thermoleophilia bacterium SCSIO 60948]